MEASSSMEATIRYHEQTKHHFRRYARSLGYMDWENQPNPFRTYEDVEHFRLPFLEKDPPASHSDLYARGSTAPRPFAAESIGAFLELALGLSAWKSVPGSRWALRINPSSGNLHPTESHLILPAMPTLPAGIFHYNPLMHTLERRAPVPDSLWEAIAGHMGNPGFLVALTSIFWRESWKYGERAFRYCNHDVGHALACLSFSANLQGWRVKCLNALSDNEVARILGFHKVEWIENEAEVPELLCYVFSGKEPDVRRGLPSEIVSALAHLPFTGRPNTLSGETVRWEAISQAASHTSKPATSERTIRFVDRPYYQKTRPSLTASQIIRKRRSAVSFSAHGSLGRDQFLAILDRTIPRIHHAPFDVELMESSIHLLLFVHSVRDLEQGLCCLVRNDDHLKELQSMAAPTFLWSRVHEEVPLYFLQAGDFRRTATRVSCDQEIAGESVFSLGMIARFRETLQIEPYRYRHLFWESGMVGQVLYLEAEAHGVRGTGIGCFYDDPVHDVLGLRSNAFQSLYHFTIGEPVEDRRLATLPPYSHLASG